MATSNFPMFGTGKYFATASGAGTAADPFVQSVAVGGVGPLSAELDANGEDVSNVGTLTATTATVDTVTASVLDVEQTVYFDAYISPTYASTIDISSQASFIKVNGVSTTSATTTITYSGTISPGQLLLIQTSATASGTVTATFSGVLHSSGTQATTASKVSNILFIADPTGATFYEISRTTALS